MRYYFKSRLGQVQTTVGDFVLQRGGQVIDISGGDVDRHAVLKKGCAVAADRITPDLQK
jgi:hypothetical protein